MPTTTGTFDVQLTPDGAEFDGAAARMSLTKTWHGGISGDGAGYMMSAGDPQAGEAGYVAIEVVEGSIDGRAGRFVLQQYGQMSGGRSTLTYAVVPGSGTDALTGLTGELTLTIDEAGAHTYSLDYTLPA